MDFLEALLVGKWILPVLGIILCLVAFGLLLAIAVSVYHIERMTRDISTMIEYICGKQDKNAKQ